MLSSGLAADAFAVSLSKGAASEDSDIIMCIRTGLWFGIFQGIMPAAGYFTGSLINRKTESIGILISFFLLFIIGTEMIRSSGKDNDNISFVSDSRSMLMLSFATSFDAFTAGTAISMNKIYNIFFISLSAGLITFIMSAAGVKIGSCYGVRHRKTARIAGGTVLIIIALKIIAGFLFGNL